MAVTAAGGPTHLFLSYAWPDHTTAETVCQLLEARGWRCWMAPRDIPPGVRYGAAIVDAIAQSTALVLLVSAHANVSEQVLNEVERALSYSKPLLPLRMEPVTLERELAYFIARRQWIEAAGVPLGAVVEQVVGALRRLTAPDVARSETPVTPSAPAPLVPDAERRQLTVLFCDLIGSTALSAQLEAEELREVVRAYQATCAEVIQRFDGHIAQYLGDGLLVYFGWPQAHEDDAQRAVRAGLGMLAAMGPLNTRLEQEHGLRLAIRVGIHTGLVVVGEMGGGGKHEQLALGDTPNIAARLQSLARPDTVVISAATYRLVQGYVVCQDRGLLPLPGMAAPLQVYDVLRESEAQTRLDIAGPRGLTPLVGRDAEVALLLERWRQATEGLGQVVLLSGEPGIGKSRLVQVLSTRVVDEGAVRIVFRCSPYHTSSALSPVIAHLQRFVRLERDDPPETRLARLEQRLRAYPFALAEAVPLMATLLAVPFEARYAPLRLTPPQQKHRTLDLLVAWLLAEAEQQPVLAVWEDLHWADPTTLELVSLLVDQVPTARLLAVLTCRPTFQAPWPSRAHLTPLTLTRLSRPQVEAMVRQLTGSQTLPEGVMALLVTRTDGVPLFVEEVTRAMCEAVRHQQAAAGYEHAAPLADQVIPSTLHDALMARLDRLGTARTVAQLGATLGRQFPYELLQAIAGLGDDALQHELRQLVEAELLYQRGRPPQATYTFKHALIRDVAYQALLKRTRQQYHERIARVLMAHFPDTVATQPEVVARHCAEAGLHAPAVAHWRRAGQQATERSAFREAMACYEQALEALQHLPDSRATRTQGIDLRLDLRHACTELGELERLYDDLRTAERLAATLDDPRRQGWIACYLANYFYRTAAYDQQLEAGRRAVTLAAASGELALQVAAQFYLSLGYWGTCDYRQAIALSRGLLARCDGAHRTERFGLVGYASVLARMVLAWSLAEQGAFAEAVAFGEEGMRIVEAAAHPGSLTRICWGLGHAYLLRGEVAPAIPLLERALHCCQEAHMALQLPLNSAQLGHAYALAGRLDDALRLLHQAEDPTSTLNTMRYYYSLRVAWLSEAYRLAGRFEEAGVHARRAHELALSYKERGCQAWILRLLGDLAAQRPAPAVDEAEAAYRQALVLAEELGMRPLQAHCRYGLGSLYCQSDRCAQARLALSTAVDLYRAMGMRLWLPRAEAALLEVESHSGQKEA